MSTLHKVILGIALAVSFAPFLAYLLFGLLFLPMWLLMFGIALIQGDPEVIHFMPVVVPLLGGLAGTASMYHVICRVYGFSAKKRDSRWVLVGILGGAWRNLLFPCPVSLGLVCCIRSSVDLVSRLPGSRVPLRQSGCR